MLHNFTLQIGFFFFIFQKLHCYFEKKKYWYWLFLLNLIFLLMYASNFSFSIIKICYWTQIKTIWKENLGIWEHWPGGRKIQLESDCLPRPVQPLSGSRSRGGEGGTEYSRSVAGSYGQGQGRWWRAAWWFSERSTGQRQI